MKSRIFYHCYDHNRPTGGQKDTYQHVDALTSLGHEAYIVHAAPGFRLTWFENDTPVIDAEAFRRLHDPERDYVVLPEDLGLEILTYAGRKVIFNKNVYTGCRVLCAGEVDPYQTPDVEGVFAVSEHNAELLRLSYPDQLVSALKYDIRADRFPFRPLSGKKPQIACVPKAPGQLGVLYQTLRARARSGHNRLDGFTWVVLDGMDEAACSKTLQDSLMLVFLSVEEGLPRTPLEAICAGCLVVAYSTGALRECLPAGCGFAYGDVRGVVDYIEDVAARFPNQLDDGGAVQSQRDRIAATFSATRQREDVARAWDLIFRRGTPVHRPAAAAPAPSTLASA